MLIFESGKGDRRNKLFHELCVTWHGRGEVGVAGGSLLQFPHLIFQVKP